jgi:predicted phage tail protein
MSEINSEYARVISPGGAGGLLGGGSGTTPPPSSSLQSVAFATFLDLLCEGEIKGLVNGLQSIYLNGVPVQESNGTNNFVGATIAWTNGTQTQGYLPGFSSVEATAVLGTQVLNSVPVTSQIDNPEADAVVITLSVGGLSSTDTSSGDISGTTAQLTVNYQPSGGSWIEAFSYTFNGYTNTKYEKSFRFPLTGTGPWTVQVVRNTPDSDNVDLVNPTYVDAVTTVVDTKLAYPNSALVGFQIDARQFASIPTRTYLIQGLLIRLPNNYDPVARTYTGAWDGGFQIAYSSNPAWCLYDLLTSDRYGLGLYLNTSDIDVTSLYEIGQYCDELVPDGFGGQEPRFQLNTCITTPKGAYDVVQDLCSVFRGMTYWGAGTILTTQDAPWQGPMPLFSPANIVGGQFSYSGSQRRDRHTVAYVTYNDPNQLYAQATEYVEDPDGIARYGVRAANIMAVGCTTRGQAYRLGKWQLLSERLDTDQCQFQAGMDAAQLTPGTVIQIADPVRAGERMGGRVVAGTTGSITLDAPVVLDPGQTYTLYFSDETGAQQSVGVVNTMETTNELTFTTSAPTAPNPGFMWALSGSNLNTQLFRVINVQESARNVFDVLAVTYNESKFDGVDFNTALLIPPISLTLSLVALLPSSWSVTDTSYLIAPGVLGQKLLCSWSGNSAQYMFQWRVNGGPWQTVTLKTPAYTVTGVTAGDIYDFQVYGISVDGTTSQPLVETFTVPVLGAPPGAPTSLTAQGQIQSVLLNWAAPGNIDLNYFQVFESSTNNIANAVMVGNNVGTTTWTVGGLVAGATYYYWVRAVNTSGVVGPYNATLGTAATVLAMPLGDFDLGTILYDIANAQEINGALIANQTITNANIAAQAVASVNIQNAAIATAQIQNGAVTAQQIAAASITTACIAQAAITTALIANAAIGTAQIQFEAVTSALIANEAVGTAQIEQLSVNTLQVADHAITVQAAFGGLGNGQTAVYPSSGGVLVVALYAAVGYYDTGVNGGGPLSSTVTITIAGSQLSVTGTGGPIQSANAMVIQPPAGTYTVSVSSPHGPQATITIFEALK